MCFFFTFGGVVVEVVVVEVEELVAALEVDDKDVNDVVVAVKELNKEDIVELVVEISCAELSINVVSGELAIVCDSEGCVFRKVFVVSTISSLDFSEILDAVHEDLML